jgi:putative transposase
MTTYPGDLTDVEWSVLYPSGKEFTVRPWCWIVERTLAWIDRSRRLSKDYERKVQTGEYLIEIAMIRLMVRRLAP